MEALTISEVHGGGRVSSQFNIVRKSSMWGSVRGDFGRAGYMLVIIYHSVFSYWFFRLYFIDSSTTELIGGLPKVLNLNPLLRKLNRPIYLQLSDRSELLVRRCEGLLLLWECAGCCINLYHLVVWRGSGVVNKCVNVGREMKTVMQPQTGGRVGRVNLSIRHNQLGSISSVVWPKLWLGSSSY